MYFITITSIGPVKPPREITQAPEESVERRKPYLKKLLYVHGITPEKFNRLTRFSL